MHINISRLNGVAERAISYHCQSKLQVIDRDVNSLGTNGISCYILKLNPTDHGIFI